MDHIHRVTFPVCQPIYELLLAAQVTSYHTVTVSWCMTFKMLYILVHREYLRLSLPLGLGLFISSCHCQSVSQSGPVFDVRYKQTYPHSEDRETERQWHREEETEKRGEGIVSLDRRRNRTQCGNQSVSIIRIFNIDGSRFYCCIYKWLGEGEERELCHETLSSLVTEPGVWLFQQPHSSQTKSSSAIFLQHLPLILSRILFLNSIFSNVFFLFCSVFILCTNPPSPG